MAASVPAISGPLLTWFTWYARRYLRRHFHSLRVSRSGLPPTTGDLPLVVYSNHASWWDALSCLVIKQEFFPDRRAFAPMDVTMIERYKFFGRLGFFGVEQRTRRGAVHFLRTAEAILASPQTILCITPQSRFADVRERPVRFERGLGHLATRVSRGLFVPIAIEYVFWEERLPEALVRFGEPVGVANGGGRRSATEWTQIFEQKLAGAQDALASEVMRRQSGDFQTILRGGAGQGGVYDWWRALKARWQGAEFRKEHGLK